MDVIFVEEGEAGLPALLSEPVFDLPGALLLSARAAAADQHAAFFDHIEIAAFEGAGRHHVVDRDAEPLVGADRPIILAAPPHRGDDRAIGRHHAGIARIDLHRQFRRGLVPMDGHAETPIGVDEVLMLRLGDLDVARRRAQMLARQRARRKVLQMRGRAEQHVGQHIRLVAKAPARELPRAALRLTPAQREGFKLLAKGHGASRIG